MYTSTQLGIAFALGIGFTILFVVLLNDYGPGLGKRYCAWVERRADAQRARDDLEFRNFVEREAQPWPQGKELLDPHDNVGRYCTLNPIFPSLRGLPPRCWEVLRYEGTDENGKPRYTFKRIKGPVQYVVLPIEHATDLY